MKRLATTIFAVLIVFGIARAQQNVVAPGDFNGGDLVLITGQSLTGGTYSNIRNFVIESGNEVSIIGATGVVTISAEHIRIAGVLNGIGAGYRGGLPGPCPGFSPGNPGGGPGGGSGGLYGNQVHGNGGAGGGYGGKGGASGHYFQSGPGANPGGPVYGSADPHTIEMGSGGGAGANYFNCLGTGGIGGSGGGGMVLQSLSIDLTGQVLLRGETGRPGTSSFNAFPSGGGGSGGGLLVRSSGVISGLIDVSGGDGGDATAAGLSIGGAGGGGGRIKIIGGIDLSAGQLIVSGGRPGLSYDRLFAQPQHGEIGVVTLNLEPTITTTITQSSLCNNGIELLTVDFTTLAAFNEGNVFTAQLSDANGDFASPLNIGSVGGISSGTIEATLPPEIPPGSGYRIRVVSSDPLIVGSESSELAVHSAPVLAVPAIAPVGNEPGTCEASVPFEAFASGELPASVIFKIGEVEITSPHTFPVGITTVTAIASNACGSDTRSFTVDVRDVEAPVPDVASLPAIRAECSANLTPPSAVDNCAGVVLATTTDPTSFATQGNFTVTWVYNDGHGNLTAQTQNVTIQDLTPPDIVLPESMTVNNDENACGAVVEYQIPPPSDNCVAENVTDYQLTNIPYSPYNMSDAELVGFFCDDCQFGPVILPYRFNFYGNDFTEVHVYPSTNGFISFQPTSQGCCQGQSLPNSSYPNSIFAAWSDWVPNIHYKLFGSAPNRIAVFQIAGRAYNGGGEVNTQIALHETTNQVQLVYTTVSNNTYRRTAGLNKDGSTAHPVPGRNATIGWTTQNESLMFTPNYGVSVVQTEGLPSGSLFPIGTTTNTFRMVDAAGNVTIESFNITVVDEQLPAVLTQNIEVELDEQGEVSIVPSQINNGSSDNCSIPVDGYAIDKANFTCAEVGDNTVTLTVTDINGNANSATAIVTVKDNINPIALGKDITVQLDHNGRTVILPQDVDDGSSDACGIQSLALSLSEFTCDNVGTHTITLTVTDNNGNASPVDVEVTVEDNIAPTVAGKDITVQLDASGRASILPQEVDDGSADACGIQSIALSQSGFTCDDLGPNAVTLTVTDVNGNVSTADVMVTVVDDEPPVMLCPADIVLSACEPVATWDIPGASDNCSVSVSQTAGPGPGSVFENGTSTTITYTAADPAGNETSCSFTVTRAPMLTSSVTSNKSVLYFGLSSDQPATIVARAQGGRAPYTISITMNRPLNCNVVTSSGDETWVGGLGTASESNTVCPASGSGMIPVSSSFSGGIAEGGSYSVVAALMQDALVTATVTDADGCVVESTISIKAEDVRCYAGKSGITKVSICHTTGSPKNPCQSICVDETSLADHLAHGDFVGICTSDCMDGNSNASARSITPNGTVIDFGEEISLNVYPTPVKSSLSITIANPDNQPVQMYMADMKGVNMLSNTPVLSSEGIYQVNTEQFPRGFYILRVHVGMLTRVVKIVKE